MADRDRTPPKDRTKNAHPDAEAINTLYLLDKRGGKVAYKQAAAPFARSVLADINATAKRLLQAGNSQPVFSAARHHFRVLVNREWYQFGNPDRARRCKLRESIAFGLLENLSKHFNTLTELQSVIQNIKSEFSKCNIENREKAGKTLLEHVDLLDPALFKLPSSPSHVPNPLPPSKHEEFLSNGLNKTPSLSASPQVTTAKTDAKVNPASEHSPAVSPSKDIRKEIPSDSAASAFSCPMSLKEIAQKFGKSESTIGRWLKSGQIKAKKMGSSWRVAIEELPITDQDDSYQSGSPVKNSQMLSNTVKRSQR